MDDIMYEPITRLRIAIIEQAMLDYKKTLGIKGRPRRDLGFNKRECLKFFRSKWCELLTGGVDSEEIIKAAKMQFQYEEWREKKGCKNCPKDFDCVHKSGKHYTAVEKNELYCQKEEKKNGKRRKKV